MLKDSFTGFLVILGTIFFKPKETTLTLSDSSIMLVPSWTLEPMRGKHLWALQLAKALSISWNSCLNAGRTRIQGCDFNVSKCFNHSFLILPEFEMGWCDPNGRLYFSLMVWTTTQDNFDLARPLVYAAERGNLDMVQFLIEARANPDSRVDVWRPARNDFIVQTPLTAASFGGHGEVVDFLKAQLGGSARSRTPLPDLERKERLGVGELLLFVLQLNWDN